MDYTNPDNILMGTAHLNVMSNFTTGNQLYDLFMTVVMMSLISYAMTNVKQIHFDFFWNSCCYKKSRKFLEKRVSCMKRSSELVFEATYIPRRNGNTYMDTTKAFDSIIDYLNQKGIVEDVYSKSEIKTRRGDVVSYDCYGDILENNTDDEVTYSYSVGTVLELEKDIMVEFSDRHERNNESVDGKNIEITRKISMITIYSYKKNVSELEKFVNNIYSKYCRKIESRFSNQMHYLSYHGIKDKDERFPIWKSYPFDTVKTYDNFFCEDKDKIFEQIENIRNSKEEYKRCGKPFQINILIHSPHFGCGKTSLLKLLAKMLGNEEKKRHIVNINLSNVKTCSELEDIFLCNDDILGQDIPNDERIYVFDEIDKVSDILLDEEYREDTLDEKIINDMKKYIETNKVNKEKEKEFGEFFAMAKKVTVENFSKDDSLNLGFFLTLMDGPIEYHDRNILATANEIKKISPAVLRRFDLIIELKLANNKIAREIISHCFNYCEEDASKEVEEAFSKIPDYIYAPYIIFNECLKNKKFPYYSTEDKEKDIINTIDIILGLEPSR